MEPAFLATTPLGEPLRRRMGMASSTRNLCYLLAVALIAATPLHAPAQFGFTPNPHLYNETADPAADILAAEKAARPTQKRVLLEFGGNWCGDCQVLDYYYRQQPNADLIAQHYIVVRVDIGHMDHNVATAEKYHVPITKGVPALAILDARGNLLYSEQPKEFEHTSPEAITAFLNRWKG